MATTYTGQTAPVGTVDGEALALMKNKVSWGAIFAGVVVALVVQVLLSMLGAGVGIATIDVAGSDTPAVSTLSIGAGIWYVLTGILAAYVGGFVAARMSGKTEETSGALHGLTTWAFTTLFTLYLLSTAIGGIVGGAFSGVSSLVGGVTQTVAQTAAPSLANSNPLDAIAEQVQATGTDPEALNAEAVDAVRAMLTGNAADADANRQRAAEALSAARGVPLDQAEARVREIEDRYTAFMTQAEATATEAADTAASVVSTGALLAFFALVLGARRRLVWWPRGVVPANTLQRRI